jgi:hypothetical protein
MVGTKCEFGEAEKAMLKNLRYQRKHLLQSGRRKIQLGGGRESDVSRGRLAKKPYFLL